MDWAAEITQSLFSLSLNEGMAHQHSHFEDHLANGTAVWGQAALAAEDAAAPVSRVSLGGCSAGDHEDVSCRLVAQLCCEEMGIYSDEV